MEDQQNDFKDFMNFRDGQQAEQRRSIAVTIQDHLGPASSTADQSYVHRLVELGRRGRKPRSRSPINMEVSNDAPPPPPPDHNPTRERQRRPEEPEEGGYDTAEEGVAPQSSHSILTSLQNGANSTLANMGAGLVHGGVWAAGAAASAVGRGVFRGVSHLATGSNPLEVEAGGGDEAGSEADAPMRPYPKAKAKAHPGKSMSSGSRETPMPWPARPWVDPSSYNGTGAHAFYIGDSEDDRSPPRPAAAAAAPQRPRGRPIAQRDVRLARETLNSMPENDRNIYARSRRRG